MSRVATYLTESEAKLTKQQSVAVLTDSVIE